MYIILCVHIILLCYVHRVIAVVFQKRIVVLDAGSFENKFVIRSEQAIASALFNRLSYM